MKNITNKELSLRKGEKVNKEWLAECNQFIDQNLRDELRSVKGVFLPGDFFYLGGANMGDSQEAQKENLYRMASEVLKWLGLRLDRSELLIDFKKDLQPAGLYAEKDGKHVIFINAKYRKDRFAVGAILAHELMHFYLLGKKNVKMENVLENELLTDLCTVRFGLGVIIVNGMTYSNSWFISLIALAFGFAYWRTEKLSFGYFAPKQYGKLVHENLKEKNLTINEFGGHVNPKSRSFLPIRFWKYFKVESHSNYMGSLIRKSKMFFALKITAIFVAVFGLMYVGHLENIKEEEMVVQLYEIEQLEEYFDQNTEEVDTLISELELLEEQLEKHKSKEGTKIYDKMINLYDSKIDEFTVFQIEYFKYEKLIKDYNSKI